MYLKEALDILNISQSALSQHVKAGRLRYTIISRHKYDYNEADVYALAQKKLEPKERKRPLFPIDRLAELLDWNVEQLRRRKRSVELVDQRRVVASVMKRCGYTHQQIGAFLNRDHSTVTILLQTSYLVEKEVKQAMQLLNM